MNKLGTDPTNMNSTQFEFGLGKNELNTFKAFFTFSKTVLLLENLGIMLGYGKFPEYIGNPLLHGSFNGACHLVNLSTSEYGSAEQLQQLNPRGVESL